MSIDEVRSWPTASAEFPYDVEAIVGEGGMGVVYRAVEPALGRFVAVRRCSRPCCRSELGEASGGWGIEEALTRYEGFVRIGPRRGFHLLLVTDTGTGFEPILPA